MGETIEEKQIAKLFDKMDDLSLRMAVIETKQDGANANLTQLATDTRAIRENGCSKASFHADHESRIRAIEMAGRGGMALAGGGGVGIGAVIVAILQWLTR